MSDDRNQESERSILAADITTIRQLATLMSEQNLAEIEVRDGKSKIRLSRQQSQPYKQSTAALAQSEKIDIPEQPSSSASNRVTITAPLIGTAYLAPELGGDPFARIGDTIAEGQTLMIIEAMKVINHIPSPCSGRLISISISDGAPVEYGQDLAILET